MRKEKATKEEVREIFQGVREFLDKSYNGVLVDGKPTYPASFYEKTVEEVTNRAKGHKANKPVFCNSMYVAAYDLVAKHADGPDATKAIDLSKSDVYLMLGALYRQVANFESDPRDPNFDPTIWEDWMAEAKKIRERFPGKITDNFVMAYTRALAEETI